METDMKAKFRLLSGVSLMSETQMKKVKGGVLPGEVQEDLDTKPGGCGCCLCSPEVKGAGSRTATISG